MTHDFLQDRAGPRPWSGDSDGDVRPHEFFLGQGRSALEVAVAHSASVPSRTAVRRLWKSRHGNTASPLLLVVLYPGGATLCGPVGSEPPVYDSVQVPQAERIAAAALDEPDRHAAIRLIRGFLAEIDADLPGIRNEGMFASHELREGVPHLPQWEEACKEGREMLHLGGRDLVDRLGFDIEPKGHNTSVLRVRKDGSATAIAVFLDAGESPELSGGRFRESPVTTALARAQAENLDYVILTRRREIRIYGAGANIGVGRKGRAETYLEANLGLIREDHAGFLPLLFGAQALERGGTFETILEHSRDFAAALGARLRARIYDHVVPALASAIAEQRRRAEGGGSIEPYLEEVYESAMVTLFRLLFVAYGEDKGLLPYEANDLYRRNALKTTARHLARRGNDEGGLPAFDAEATVLWEQVRSLWHAVDRGSTEWAVPVYNGGLFSSGPEVNAAGARLAGYTLTNQAIGPALFHLLVDENDDGLFGPVDFRALSVREFGTIYEGLLESSLALASEDLTLDSDNRYVPASGEDEVVVTAGTAYLQNQSGQRKASGTYFTRAVAVEHLLDHALEPALGAHMERLERMVEAGEEAQAARELFDFRVSDIAMGSGHFLVAAVDRIEIRFSDFLERHPLPKVTAELERLRKAAADALGPLSGAVEIERSSLLRRQIARRCIYGVDLNRIAVELARVSIWTHTFVPGLPLTFLNHNLVQGNSLVGIATLEEALRTVDPGHHGMQSLWREPIERWLSQAEDALARLGQASDATAQEVHQARDAQAEARSAVEPARRLFDLLIAARLGSATLPTDVSDEATRSHPDLGRAETLARELGALHFPVAFPEVFLRERSGFDCILGNPPWDKVRFEPQQFWVLRAPGLNTMQGEERDQEIERLRKACPLEAAEEKVERKQREQLQDYVADAYLLQGRGRHGHHDFAKLFTERVLQLVGRHGHLGLVLPRQALVLKGWTDLRFRLAGSARLRVLQARNRRAWLFEDVHGQLMMTLISRGPAEEGEIRIWPGVDSERDLRSLDPQSGIVMSEGDLAALNDEAVIPWFASARDVAVFDRMKPQPALVSGDGWIAGEADSSRWDFSGSGRHKTLASTTATPGAWGVLMARHVDQFVTQTDGSFNRYIPEPGRLVEQGLDAVQVDGRVQLSEAHPAIIYRYPTSSSNTRTLIASLLPADGVLYSKGYVHGLRTPPDTPVQSVLALLGYLNTFTCDWWTRRFVDRHVTQSVIQNLPLPDWSEDERERVAEMVAELMARSGVQDTAGARALPRDDALADVGTDTLRVRIEHATLAGLGLGAKHLEIVLHDFTTTACPAALRDEMLDLEAVESAA